MRIQSGLLSVLIAGSSSVYSMGGKQSLTPNGDVFEALVIPGATCGDGSPYSIYIRNGDPSKVLLHFEGGGACWSGLTCHGKVPFASLHSSPSIFKNVYLGKHIGDNPFENHTYVYMPYCTGDIHAGSHKAVYDKKKGPVLHYGRSNFTKALEWFEFNHNNLIAHADKIVMYGESAGAIGVIANLDQVTQLTSAHADKTALIDSAGLHFNDTVWRRFTPEYLRDLDRSLNSNSIVRHNNSGILAPQMRDFCEANPDWKVGFTQSTQDIVMSLIFGNLTPIQHHARVMSKKGLHKMLLDPSDNCSSWIPDSTKHMFSISPGGWKKETRDGVSNGQFTSDLVQSHLLDRHPSHH